MAKINLEYLILEVLENELSNDNDFLSAGEIAYRCNGLCYERKERRKYPIVGRMIKIRMCSVKKTAIQNEFVVTSRRLKHTKNGGKSNEVLGWKIADEADKPFVLADMEVNKFLANGHTDSMKRVIEIGKRKGLLSPNDVLSLNE